MHEIVRIDADAQQTFVDAALALEAKLFEPARRETRQRIERCVTAGLAHAHFRDGLLAAYALALPLEDVLNVPGPAQDPQAGRHTTLYSVALGVCPNARGQGLGHALKQAQIADARDHFRFVSGRQRMPEAAAMWRLNRRFGAELRTVLRGAYGEPDGLAYYYRIDVTAPTRLNQSVMPNHKASPTGSA